MGDPSGLGPVQILVVGLDRAGAEEVLERQLREVAANRDVALLDVLVVHRQRNGSFAELRERRLELLGSAEGAIVAPLLGLGNAEPTGSPDRAGDGWCLADHVAAGSTAAIVLLEHRWAIPLRDAVKAIGAEVLVDAWVHPHDLAPQPE